MKEYAPVIYGETGNFCNRNVKNFHVNFLQLSSFTVRQDIFWGTAMLVL